MKKRPVGRPRELEYDREAVLGVLARHTGAGTVTQLQRELGILNAQYYDWIKRYPEFLEAVTRIRAQVDDKVESSLYDRAIGYEITTKEVTEGAKGKTVKHVEHHVQPDPQAAKFWLVNRRRDIWADRKTVEVKGGLKDILEHAAETLDLSPDDWEDVTDG